MFALECCYGNAEVSHASENPLHQTKCKLTPRRPRGTDQTNKPIFGFNMSLFGQPAEAQFWTLDVFTRDKFKGNQLAVVFTTFSDMLVDGSKQKIAKEFNLSETVFVGTESLLPESDPISIPLRIFTPAEELPFAGHPIIGAACALALKGDVRSSGTFTTRAGHVKFHVECARPQDQRALARAEIEVPYQTHLHKKYLPMTQLRTIQPTLNDFNADDEYPVFSITKGMTYALVKVPSRNRLSELKKTNTGVPVNLDADWSPSFVGFYYYYRAPSHYEGDPIKLHTRMFEPELGEDAVTGSAACALSAYLAFEEFKRNRNQQKFEFRIIQGEDMGRKGTPTVVVELTSSGDISSMTLKGDTIRIMKGVIENKEY